MSNVRRVLRALLLPAGAAGCLAAPPSDRDAIGPLPELAAFDHAGRPADPGALPRSPELRLRQARALADGDALVLLAGRADDALIDDLSRAPLRAEHQARGIEASVVPTQDGAALRPARALDADADYTFALLGLARARDGARVVDDDRALLLALHTASGDAAGARVVRTFPAEGASGVATNLEAAVIALDGEIRGAEEGVWIEGPDGFARPCAIQSGPCAEVAREHGSGHCVRLVPDGALAPLADHVLALDRPVRDAQDAPLPSLRVRFRTGTGPDTRAPLSLPLTCAPDELPIAPGCALVQDHAVLVRVRADEPVIAGLSGAGEALYAVADRGELELRAAGLAADTPVALTLSLRDAAGNAERHELALRTTEALASVSVNEVRADPLGPEPAQELVELHNYGAAAVDLLGFSLVDDPAATGVPFERSQRIDPGARVLLVGAAFDARETRDGALPAGVTLVRMPGALAGSGLSNAGEPLVLRDALGRRVSAAPATPRPRSGVCSVRVVEDPRDGRDGAFAYDAEGGCTPGY